MFEVGPCRHVRLAAGREPADALPILAGSLEIAFEPADIAAFEQRRNRIRRLRERLLDIGERRIETAEGAVRRSAVDQRVDAARLGLQDMIEVGDRPCRNIRPKPRLRRDRSSRSGSFGRKLTA